MMPQALACEIGCGALRRAAGLLSIRLLEMTKLLISAARDLEVGLDERVRHSERGRDRPTVRRRVLAQAAIESWAELDKGSHHRRFALRSQVWRSRRSATFRVISLCGVVDD